MTDEFKVIFQRIERQANSWELEDEIRMVRDRIVELEGENKIIREAIAGGINIHINTNPIEDE